MTPQRVLETASSSFPEVHKRLLAFKAGSPSIPIVIVRNGKENVKDFLRSALSISEALSRVVRTEGHRLEENPLVATESNRTEKRWPAWYGGNGVFLSLLGTFSQMVSLHILGHCVSRTVKVDASTTFISSYGCYEHDNGNHIDDQQAWMQIKPE